MRIKLSLAKDSNISFFNGEVAVLLDLEDYIATKDQAFADYADQESWKKKMLVNIAMAGFFSSDRTIKQYNDDIWKLKTE